MVYLQQRNRKFIKYLLLLCFYKIILTINTKSTYYIHRCKCIKYVIKIKVLSFTLNDDKYGVFLQGV
ncbi:hypothetical protein C0132_09300 [Priestia aryabhattai]